MENNLKNRYIYAVTRHLPVKMQYDVERELDSLISEMLDERRGNNAFPSEQDLKDVLAELGSPEELALKYGGNERRALISGVNFLIYKRILLIVLPIIATVLAVLTTLGFFIGDGSSMLIFVGVANITVITHTLQIVTVTIGGVVQAFAVITVIFAVLEYNKVEIKDIDFFDLPVVPEAKMKISPLEPIFWIVFSIVTTIIFLGFPHVLAARIGGSWVTVLDIGVIRGLWFPILMWTLFEITAEVVKLVEGRYNMRVASVTVISCILQMICVVVVFGNNDIVNPELISHIENWGLNIQAMGGHLSNLLTRPSLGAMVILLIILVWEIVEVIVKTVLAKRL